MKKKLKIQRGTGEKKFFEEFEIEADEGMVVLDLLHKLQASQAPDLAVRWNCKAGKCGSCGAEVNGKPVLLCMCRINSLPQKEKITVTAMKAFPVIRDLVADVSWNYEQNKKIKPFTPDLETQNREVWRMQQRDVDRVQEFRKCIECFLCQDVCHVLREQGKHQEYFGPRFFVRTASLDMHPLDSEERLEDLKSQGGIGLCNITKCCTEVCPEEIQITDNAIIPLKERVADKYYDPIKTFLGKLF